MPSEASCVLYPSSTDDAGDEVYFVPSDSDMENDRDDAVDNDTVPQYSSSIHQPALSGEDSPMGDRANGARVIASETCRSGMSVDDILFGSLSSLTRGPLTICSEESSENTEDNEETWVADLDIGEREENDNEPGGAQDEKAGLDCTMPCLRPLPQLKPLHELSSMSCVDVRERLESFFIYKEACERRFREVVSTSLASSDHGRASPHTSHTSTLSDDEHQRHRCARLVNTFNWDTNSQHLDVLLPAALVPSSPAALRQVSGVQHSSPLAHPQGNLGFVTASRVPTAARTLRPHQVEGIRFMWNVLVEGPVGQVPSVGCILAHTMGLGKTAQVAVFLHLFLAAYGRQQRVLLVAPKSTSHAWELEFCNWSKYFPATHRISPIVIAEAMNPQVRVDIFRNWRKEGGVLLIGYEALVRLLKLVGGMASNYGHRGQIDLSRLESKMGALDEQPDCDSHPVHVDDGNVPILDFKNDFTELIVCDEAHRLRSSQLSVVQALRSLNAVRRLLLTGTPLQNHLQEYFAMLDFAMHKYFDQKHFKKFFVHPIESSLDRRASPEDVALAHKKTFILINEVRYFVHRVDSTPLILELPPLHEYVVVIPPSDLQVALYVRLVEMCQSNDAILQFWSIASWAGKIAAHPQLLFSMGEPMGAYTSVASAKQYASSSLWEAPVDEAETVGSGTHRSLSQRYPSTQFRELCIPPPGYVLRPEDGMKLYVAILIVKEALQVNERVLFFSFSTKLLDLFELLIAKVNLDARHDGSLSRPIRYSRLDGTHTSAQRVRLLREFDNKDGPDVFLLSVKAGGVGLTITSATRVILADTNFNPADDQQAIGRAYRYGQTKPVFVYRLLCYPFLEHFIFEQKLAKESLFKAVIDETSTNREGLSGMHIRDIYRLLEETANAAGKPIAITPVQKAETESVAAEDPIVATLKTHVLYVMRYDRFLERDSATYGEEEEKFYRYYQSVGIFNDAEAWGQRPVPTQGEVERKRQRDDTQQQQLSLQSKTLTGMLDDLIRTRVKEEPHLTQLLTAVGMQVDESTGSVLTKEEARRRIERQQRAEAQDEPLYANSFKQTDMHVFDDVGSSSDGEHKYQAARLSENQHTPPDLQGTSSAPHGTTQYRALASPTQYAQFRPGSSPSTAIEL